jgi:hypothetical protein
MRTILRFAAATEMATGIGFIFAPALVIALLVRGDISDLTSLVARVLGITLLALGLAGWPGRQDADGGMAAFRGLLTYNALVALLLAYVGAVRATGGPLLWPVVAVHGVVALLLVWSVGVVRRQR